MSDRCPGSGQRTRRGPRLADPDRCPVCNRIAYVRADGATGNHRPRASRNGSDYSDTAIGGLGSGPRYPTAGDPSPQELADLDHVIEAARRQVYESQQARKRYLAALLVQRARRGAHVNGHCDFCPRPGRLATCMCVHEHRVGVWVCAEKHEPWLGTVEIACRLCDEGERHHICALHEVGEL